MQDFFCTCEVHFFFFLRDIFFWLESVGIQFFINNFLRKFFFFAFAPRPQLLF